MRDVPELDFAATVYGAGIKDIGPWLMGWLEVCSGFVVTVVQGFGQAENVDEPGDSENDGWNVVATSSIDIESNVAAYNSCEVGAVADTGGLSVITRNKGW